MPKKVICSNLVLAAIAFTLSVTIHGQSALDGKWTTAWGTSQQNLGETQLSNTTVRLIARVTAGGHAVRIRLDNTFASQPLVVGSVTIGTPMQGARLSPGSNHVVTFAGAGTVTVPAGGSARSDAISMTVLPQQDLAVSLYIPENNIRPSQHNGARVTSFQSPNGSGDHTSYEPADTFTETTQSMYWLKSIDVLNLTSPGAIVAFGDSITDGSCATLNGHDRWEDWLAVRLHLRAIDDSYPTVINEGIGGNTITNELQPRPNSTPGVQRLERDVFSHSGVTHVVLFMGTNDIRREATTEQVISGMQEIIKRVHAEGLQIIGATIIPRHNRPPSENNSGWNPAKTAIRHEVNDWIRTEASFDGILDFDLTVQDPTNPDLIHPAFDCDGIHPNPRGYYEMGSAIPLELFRN